MVLREVINDIKATQITIHDLLSGETVAVESCEPGSLRTVQRFLHCKVVGIVTTEHGTTVNVI